MSDKLTTLFHAHVELTRVHNALHAAGCTAACKRVATALRSINTSYVAEGKRLDAHDRISDDAAARLLAAFPNPGDSKNATLS